MKNLKNLKNIIRDDDGYLNRDALLKMSVEEMLRVLMPEYSQKFTNLIREEYIKVINK